MNIPISITRKLRPLRLAFLVSPYDKKAIRRAIQLNTLLWGGIYNPLIPIYGKAPGSWKDGPLAAPAAEKILAGYIEAFDPDYIVKLHSDIPKVLPFPQERIIAAKEIIQYIREDGSVVFGLCVSELLQHLYEREFKFMRRHALNVFLPDTRRKPFSLFKSCCFGEYPEDLSQELTKAYQDLLNAKIVPIEPGELYNLMSPNNIYPLQLTALSIEPLARPGSRWAPTVFFMDASSSVDLMDFWNLRAIGRDILPVPKQWSAHLIQKVKEFITSNYVPYRHNKKMMHHTTLLKSRSISGKELLSLFFRTLDLPRQPNARPIAVMQNRYPRIEDTWARDKDNADPVELVAGEDTLELTSTGGSATFRNLTPEFAPRFDGHGKPRWANTIQLSVFGTEEFAAAIPRGEGDFTPEIHRLEYLNYRISRDGPTIFCTYKDRTHHWPLPKAQEVFFAWLKSFGWKAELSDKGHLTEQMTGQLGGAWGIKPLASIELLKMIDEMSKGGFIPVGELKSRLLAVQPTFGFLNSEALLKHLVDKKVLRVGVKLQCPFCTQHSWYSIDSLSEEVKCSKCSQQFPFPSAQPPKEAWYYQTFPPFSLPKYAHGTYSVLFAISFFLHTLRGEATIVPSFIAQKNGEKIEVDFGLLWRNSVWYDRDIYVIFGECKTFNDFQQSDVQRMRKLAKNFPGAVLVFCTLKDILSKPEKSLIQKIANFGRKPWKGDRAMNPVLVLTRIELFNDSPPPFCWEKAGEHYEKFIAGSGYINTLGDLCDATQQLHLDMPPRVDFLKQRWEKLSARHRKPSRDFEVKE